MDKKEFYRIARVGQENCIHCGSLDTMRITKSQIDDESTNRAGKYICNFCGKTFMVEDEDD